MLKINTSKSLVVYTSIFGDGYFLPKVPLTDSAEYLCFTDQSNLESNGWQIINSTPILENDLVRSSRIIKILAHNYLKEFERSIYIDPSVELIADPEDVWKFLMGTNNFSVYGALFHSFRDTVLEEFDEVYESKLDSTQLLEEHLTAYLLTNPDGLKLKPIWSGMFARKHLDPICIGIMEKWFCHVMRYSRRDQLSLPSILLEIPEHLKYLQFKSNRITDFHRWPHANYSRPPRYYSAVTNQIIPAILRAETEAKEKLKISANLSAAIAERNAAIAERNAAIAERDAAIAERDAYFLENSKKKTIEAERFLDAPIITPDKLDFACSKNICGPSLILAPDWLPNRLGNFYLYFAGHRGEYIRLAFSDSLKGPWKTYNPGTLSLDDSSAISDHLASPDVHVISANKEIRMYFHSVLPGTKDQQSFVAHSKDGINFSVNPNPITNFYLRALPWRDWWFGMTKGGCLYLSKDGISNFIKLPNPAFEMKHPLANSPGDVRHVALKFISTDLVNIYFTRIGDAPESILMASIDLSQPILKWIASKPELVLKPQTEWEGADLPLLESYPGPAKETGENALRDPAIFCYENETYMLYAVKGESGIAIAKLNELHKQQPTKKLSKTNFEIRSGLQLTKHHGSNSKNLDLDIWEREELAMISESNDLFKRVSLIDQTNPTKRIFIMGCGRSGTWLLTALFSTLSEIHVIPIETTPFRFGLYETNAKNLVMKRDHISYLDINKIPECINIAYIIRHPFDVLTSQNPTTKKKYHIDAERWLGEMRALKYLVDTKRLNTKIIRYEDLIINAQNIQTDIAEYFKLKINKSTDEIASSFSASPEAFIAMHGLRKIDTNSLYKFKNSSDIEHLKNIRANLSPMLDWVAAEYNYDLSLDFK
jgi:hypothetical protein